MPQAQVVIWSLAFLAAPGLIFPIQFADGALHGDGSPDSIAHALLTFRLFFITLTMTSIGFVALFIWDGVFPDRRDARILTPLPVPGRVLIGARLVALGALCAIFIAGINAVPTVFYAPLITHFGGAANHIQGVLAFAVANACAGIFVFATLVLLQGLALNLGGRRAADRVSLVLQVVFVAALLQMIFFMPRVGAMLPADLASGNIRAMPSIWFLGLYEVIGGRRAAGAPLLALAAIGATVMTVSGATLLFVSTHARLTRRALESRDITSARRGIPSLPRLTEGRIRQAAARAVFGFMVRSIARSRSHRLLMAMYVGIAVALVASALVPLAIRDGLAGFVTPGVELLSTPLVLSFFSLVGMRVAMAIPIEPKANWVFRLREPADRVAAMTGVHMAMLFIGVLPATAVAVSSAGALWGLWPALAHGAIVAAMGAFLVEILMIRLGKLPFTCTYFPGTSRVGTLWPLYLTGFVTYCYTLAAWEVRFMTRPGAVGTLLSVIAVAILVLSFRRRRFLREQPALRFAESDPAAIFQGFHLSEGLAARPAAAPAIQGSGRES